MINKVMNKMIDYYSGDPKRIYHFIKVYTLADSIARGENMSDRERYILDIAALVHDIGIKVSEQKYNCAAGKYQEQEGPAEAERLLSELGVERAVIERVCYLVAHHHTYNNIDGLDYQILVEADFLVNLYEDNEGHSVILKARENIFKTKTGIDYVTNIFDL